MSAYEKYINENPIGINDTFTNFEKLHGTTEFLKAIVTIQNQILVDNGITTADELRSRLQTELIIRARKRQPTQQGMQLPIGDGGPDGFLNDNG